MYTPDKVIGWGVEPKSTIGDTRHRVYQFRGQCQLLLGGRIEKLTPALWDSPHSQPPGTGYEASLGYHNEST